MTQQPEALRLAEALDFMDVGPMQAEDAEQAAAELRRLHEVNEELLAREKRWMELADIEVARCDKLQAVNKQLLEALEAIKDDEGTRLDWRMYDKARAAIAAAKEQA